MQIVFLFYDGMTALDLAGPHEILCRVPGTSIKRVAKAAGMVKTDSGLTLYADDALSDVLNADILFVPGAGNATTHWAAIDRLSKWGAEPTQKRIVESGKIITAAEVSAGIDMALTLAAKISGEYVAKTLQLGIEYDPEPPFDSGSPHKADPELLENLRKRMDTLFEND